MRCLHCNHLSIVLIAGSRLLCIHLRMYICQSMEYSVHSVVFSLMYVVFASSLSPFATVQNILSSPIHLHPPFVALSKVRGRPAGLPASRTGKVRSRSDEFLLGLGVGNNCRQLQCVGPSRRLRLFFHEIPSDTAQRIWYSRQVGLRWPQFTSPPDRTCGRPYSRRRRHSEFGHNHS